MPRLLIVGAGGHGVVVADAADESRHWSTIVFADDAFPGIRKVADWEVIGDTGALAQLKSAVDAAIVAVGNSDVRLKLLAAVEQASIPLAIVVHPRATLSKRSEVGKGTVLLANAVVNARTTIGKGCIINTSASVDHDCSVADGVHVAPGAHLAADVKVGEHSWIGAGASVREQTNIGRGVVIGAGAAVIRDVDDGMTVAGVPARALRSGAKLEIMRTPSK